MYVGRPAFFIQDWSDSMGGKPIKAKKAVVAIDFDNIYSLLNQYKKDFDYAGFILEITEKLGLEMDAIRIFTPYDSYRLIPESANALGYEIVVCQKMDSNRANLWKREDKVDSYMFMSLRNFLEYPQVTHVVILSHDKHSIELLSQAVMKRKKVIYFADKNKMRVELLDVIDKFNIPVYPLPSKDKQWKL